MKTEYYDIGEHDWGILVCYDYTGQDFDRLWRIVRSFGMSDSRAQAALSVLSQQNTGMTLTSMDDMMSIVFVGDTTSDDEWFNTIIHELKHIVEHISEFYHLNSSGEEAAYLQGEIGRKFFPLIMRRLCRK